MIHYILFALYLSVLSQTMYYNHQPCVIIRNPDSGDFACYCQKGCILDNMTGLTYPLMEFDKLCIITNTVYYAGIAGGMECWCPEKRGSCTAGDRWWKSVGDNGIYLNF